MLSLNVALTSFFIRCFFVVFIRFYSLSSVEVAQQKLSANNIFTIAKRTVEGQVMK